MINTLVPWTPGGKAGLMDFLLYLHPFPGEFKDSFARVLRNVASCCLVVF
jgi:hypothetical protein